MTPRPVRNNNPCDIEATQPWMGLMPFEQMNSEQRGEPRFAVFKSPAWGFRAAIMLLRNYYRHYGLETVDKLAARWAPPSENDTAQYVATVCRLTGFGHDQTLDMEDGKTLCTLVKAFTQMESGEWSPAWSDELLAQGAVLAGFEAGEVASGAGA